MIIIALVVVIAWAVLVLVMSYHHSGMALLLGLLWTMAAFGLIAATLNCPKWAITCAIIIPFLVWVGWKIMRDPSSNPFIRSLE